MSNYHVVKDGDRIMNVVAMSPDGNLYQATHTHPHIIEIVEGLHNGDPDVYGLFDVHSGLVKRLTVLSDRISFDGTKVLFDGDPQAGPLADHLLRCLESGVQDYQPVVKFWEKVAQNPDSRSREQLFTWLQSHDFTITEDGDILGYKGVVGFKESEFRSSHSGKAYVDGKAVDGQIPNVPGTVVTMPRGSVKNDPNASCSYGLHVGDWSYASGFAQTVLEVHVNPRDVVSIPRDSNARKMRCCKYKVVKVREAASSNPVSTLDDRWQGDVGYKPV